MFVCANIKKMKRFLKNNWIYILGAILVLSLFSLRFINLTILPVFADEAIYIRWAQVMRAEQTLRFLPLSDGKEPLFMWLIIPFFKLINNPLIAGRLVSVLAGLGTMFGIGLLSYLLFKNKIVSLVSALIYAVSPFVFFFDRMALADSLLSMFGVWTFVFSLLAFKKQRLDFAMIAGFMLGGAWLTKSPALFFALMLPTLWIFIPWQKDSKKNLKTIFITICLTFVTIFIGYGMFNILRLGPNFNMISSRNLDYVWPMSHILTSPLDPLKPFLDRSLEWVRMMGPWSILILLIGAYIVGFKKNWREFLVLSIWLLGPIVVQSEYAKVLTARYILFSIPYLIIIASSMFLTKRKAIFNLSLFVLAFLVFQGLSFNRWLLISPERANLPRSERSGYLEEWTAGHGIKETFDFLLQRQTENPKERIVIGTEGFFGTLPDGLQLYLNSYPEITAIGVGLNFSDLPSQLINSKKAGDRTYFLVNASRLLNSSENLGLKLIKEYPKAQKPDGTRDSLLLFEVQGQ